MEGNLMGYGIGGEMEEGGEDRGVEGINGRLEEASQTGKEWERDYGGFLIERMGE
jgi:hypothetical protein